MAKSSKVPALPPADGENVVLWESPANIRGEVTRACVNVFKGQRYGSIRKWYVGGGDELKPGKGFSFPFDSEGVDVIASCLDAFNQVVE